jgi:hypothetical protein
MSDATLLPVRRRHFPWLRYFLGFVLLFLLMSLPIFVSVISSNIALAQGCAVDEGSIHPCVLNGHDYGELFYDLGVAGWLIILSVPLSLLGGVVLFVAMIIHRVMWGRRQRTSP